MRAQFCQSRGIAGRVGTVLVQPGGDGFEVAGGVLQRGPRGGGQKALRHQAGKLLGGVGRGLGGVLGVLDLAGGGAVLGQHRQRQPGHLVGDQGQAAPAFVDAALEGELVGGQRVEQKGPVQRHVDDLRP